MKKTKVVFCGLMVVISTLLLFNAIGGVSSGQDIIEITSPEPDADIDGVVDIEVEVLACFCDGKTTLYIDGEFVSKGTRTGMTDDGKYEVFVHEWESSSVADGNHIIRVYDKHNDTYDEVRVNVENTDGGAPPFVYITITEPEDGSQVEGTVTVTARVPACFCDGKTTLYVDGKYVMEGTKTAMSDDGYYEIFTHQWDTTDIPDGEHSIRVYDKHDEYYDEIDLIVDNGGNGGGSGEIDIVRITSPEDNSEVKGDVTVTAEVLACFCDGKTTLYVDGEFISRGTRTGMSDDGKYEIFVHEWNSRSVSNGGHTVKVLGKHGEHSDSITVFVNNDGGGRPKEHLRIITPQNDDKIGGTITVKVEKSAVDNIESPRMYVNGKFVTEAQLVDDIDYDGELYKIYDIEWDTSDMKNGDYSVRIQDGADDGYDEIQLHIENTGSQIDCENDADVTSRGAILLSSILVIGLFTGMIVLLIRLRR